MASHGGSAMAAATLRSEVLSFRLVELQQVSVRLGLTKTGRKHELQARILAYLGELDPQSQAAGALGRLGQATVREQWRLEQAIKVVHDTFNRMTGQSPASDQSAHSSLQMPGGVGAGAGASSAALGTGQRMEQMAAMAQQQLLAQQRLLAAHHLGQQYAQPPAGQQQQQQPPGGRRGEVRCICSSLLQRGSLVQCQGRGCGVWQHRDCLGLDPQDAAQAKDFLCETCRTRLADPFWEVTQEVLPPCTLKFNQGRPPIITSHGQQEVQSADRVFYLNQQQLEPVMRDMERYRVQAGCLLVGDEVAVRYHWPKHVDVRINNMPIRPYGRAHNAKMGINQRDDVASIGSMVVRGRNALCVSAADKGTWVLTLQLARQRTLDEVKKLMAAPESMEAAVARVRRQVGGGGDDDSDDDLLISHQVVSVKDPMSGLRMAVPARFAGASGLQAFDLDSFLSMAQRNRKWQDPTTMGNSSVEQLQVDTFMQRVLRCLLSFPDVTDVEISADGQWRPQGTSCDYLDVSADPASVAGVLADALGTAGTAGSAARVRAEPGSDAGGAAAGAAANGAAAGAAEELVVDSDESEEEDELEELRKAAAAVRRTTAPADAHAGQKRKQPEPEVIDLLSSDDEEPRRPQQAQQQQQQGAPPLGSAAGPSSLQQQLQEQGQAQQPVPAAGSAPLRIRLPIRSRPQQQQTAGYGAAGQPPLGGPVPYAPLGPGIAAPSSWLAPPMPFGPPVVGPPGVQPPGQALGYPAAGYMYQPVPGPPQPPGPGVQYGGFVTANQVLAGQGPPAPGWMATPAPALADDPFLPASVQNQPRSPPFAGSPGYSPPSPGYNPSSPQYSPSSPQYSPYSPRDAAGDAPAGTAAGGGGGGGTSQANAAGRSASLNLLEMNDEEFMNALFEDS